MVTPRVVRGVGVTGDPYVMTFDSFDLSIEPDTRRFEMKPADRRSDGNP